MTETKISWDDALTSGDYVSLQQDEPKTVFIKNWYFEKVDKFGKEQIELIAQCSEEDNESVDKKFTTTSNRLKKKLRPVLEGKDPKEGIKISIIMVGDKFNTQYSVKEVQ